MSWDESRTLIRPTHTRWKRYTLDWNHTVALGNRRGVKKIGNPKWLLTQKLSSCRRQGLANGMLTDLSQDNDLKGGKNAVQIERQSRVILKESLSIRKPSVWGFRVTAASGRRLWLQSLRKRRNYLTGIASSASDVNITRLNRSRLPPSSKIRLAQSVNIHSYISYIIRPWIRR